MRRRLPEPAPEDLMFQGRRYETVEEKRRAELKWRERRKRLVARVLQEQERDGGA